MLGYDGRRRQVVSAGALLPVAPGVVPAVMERIRVGLIGAGGAAARHARHLLATGEVVLAGVADPQVERAREIAEPAGGRAHARHQDLLEREDLDAVVICVPPFAHGAPELAAVEAGLPFLVEKPLAADLGTAEHVAEAVAARGVPTAVGYQWRHLDTFQRARELLDGNPARLALLYWLDKVPPRAWWTRPELSGGQVVEQATHLLDTVRVLVGEVTQVRAEPPGGEAAPADGEVHRVGAASLRFASGAVGSLVSTSLLAGLHGAGVALYSEGLALELTESTLTVDTGEGRVVTAAQGDAKARLTRDFLDVVRRVRERACVDYAEALPTHRVACGLARSADHGRPVVLDHGQR